MLPQGHPEFKAPDSAGNPDVMLVSSDATPFLAHQRYLSTNSVFFEHMFVPDNNLLTTTEGLAIVHMEESATVLNVLLHHFYPSCSFPMAVLGHSESLDCLRAADKLENPRAISSLISNFLVDRSPLLMDPNEALQIYCAAYRYNIPALATHAIKAGLPTWEQLGQGGSGMWSQTASEIWDPVIGFEGAARLASKFYSQRSRGRDEFLRLADQLHEQMEREEEHHDWHQEPDPQFCGSNEQMMKLFELAESLIR